MEFMRRAKTENYRHSQGSSPRQERVGVNPDPPRGEAQAERVERMKPSASRWS
jgi:hypothetical protein